MRAYIPLLLSLLITGGVYQAPPVYLPVVSGPPAATATLVPTGTPIPTATATSLPTATATFAPFPPATNTPVPGAVCDCSGDLYNCSNFRRQSDAQACYNYCMQIVHTDIHRLDADDDGIACESLP